MIKVQATEFDFTQTLTSIIDYIKELESNPELQTEFNFDLTYDRLNVLKETLLQQFKQNTGEDWISVCNQLVHQGIRNQNIVEAYDCLYTHLLNINDAQIKLDKIVFSVWQRS